MTLEKLLALVNTLQEFVSEPKLTQEVKALQSAALRFASQIVAEDELNEKEINLLGDGNTKMPAIKAYRERTNVGLKDAKDKVEAYLKKVYGYTNYTYGD